VPSAYYGRRSVATTLESTNLFLRSLSAPHGSDAMRPTDEEAVTGSKSQPPPRWFAGDTRLPLGCTRSYGRSWFPWLPETPALRVDAPPGWLSPAACSSELRVRVVRTIATMGC